MLLFSGLLSLPTGLRYCRYIVFLFPGLLCREGGVCPFSPVLHLELEGYIAKAKMDKK